MVGDCLKEKKKRRWKIPLYWIVKMRLALVGILNEYIIISAIKED